MTLPETSQLLDVAYALQFLPHYEPGKLSGFQDELLGDDYPLSAERLDLVHDIVLALCHGVIAGDDDDWDRLEQARRVLHESEPNGRTAATSVHRPAPIAPSPTPNLGRASALAAHATSPWASADGDLGGAAPPSANATPTPPSAPDAPPAATAPAAPRRGLEAGGFGGTAAINPNNLKGAPLPFSAGEPTVAPVSSKLQPSAQLGSTAPMPRRTSIERPLPFASEQATPAAAAAKPAIKPSPGGVDDAAGAPDASRDE